MEAGTNVESLLTPDPPPPPRGITPVNMDPFSIDESIPYMDKIELSVKQLRRQR